ncbi:sigma-70 family RNA polymerase sigma factor [Cytophagales bacterium LB-30]|uniref:Sigma-70 family RNA polymerase sigma factor n=1 Tax=Shiella aurantiaca TaxID=3058365 RepID=A0ABT8F187_9BACT|nr:sigma-70 family RNA polymerase sigma factor [Shiella aurantiaca]MDN4164004.1 sigma-70 family RNA polymerase sigma factor [Shiella aurantiaca]
MSHAQTITLYRPLLHAIAYNMVRCKQDAEDIVQDTFLKWLSVEQSRIQNTKAYLIRSVTNSCINHLNSLKKKKEAYLEDWSEMVNKWKDTDFLSPDLDAKLQAALSTIHHKLEPLERALYVLKEGFNVDYEALQETFGKKQEHCRQIISRARKKLNDEAVRLKAEMPDSSQFIDNFKKACDFGHVSHLIQEFKKEISDKK